MFVCVKKKNKFKVATFLISKKAVCSTILDGTETYILIYKKKIEALNKSCLNCKKRKLDPRLPKCAYGQKAFFMIVFAG